MFQGPGPRPWWRRAWASRHRVLLAKYATGSAASTAVSQAVLTLVYALGGGVVTASLVAYLAGVPVNYLLQRRWTWGARGGGPRLVRYLLTVGTSAVVVVALTTLSESVITAAGWSRAVEVVLVNAAFLAVNGIVFLAKYVLFDRVVFRDGGDGDDTVPPAGDADRAATTAPTPDHP